jgi:ATP-dependent RNA helicase RhlE
VTTSFDTLGLGAQLLRAIEAAGFTEPTAVQAQTIPMLVAGRDLLGTAQTGGGKTAAYTLPMLHRLAEKGEKPIPGHPRILILAPTRELASQIGETIRTFSKGMGLYYGVVYGGAPYQIQRQALERGVHIVVATPGRLMDHLQRGTLSLDKVEGLILDEADRMLDMGFIDEVKEIAAMLPAAHQTVMFSATMSRNVRGLASALLNDPGLVEIGQENAVSVNVDHRVMRVEYPDKNSLLLHLLGRAEVSRVLVFSRTKAMADTLVQNVTGAGFRADAIHGDLPQSVRQKVLRKFRLGHINILIATDVAARGIDVPDITHVINYDMPVEAESYIHRVGRTGRAGAKGVALSICTSAEGNLLHQVERLIGIKVPVDPDQPFHDARCSARREESGRSSRPSPKWGRYGKAGNKNAGFRHPEAAPQAAPGTTPPAHAQARTAGVEGASKPKKAARPFSVAKPHRTPSTDPRHTEGKQSRPGKVNRFAPKGTKRHSANEGGSGPFLRPKAVGGRRSGS